ncbi:MAG: hypothetical protein AAFW89_14815 [Bacteroidota bacterium]
MSWIIGSCLLVWGISFWLGYLPLKRVYDTRYRDILVLLVGLLLFISAVQLLKENRIFTERTSSAVMAGLYASVAGFFSGSAVQLYRLKKKSGTVLYSWRSFPTEILPGIVALAMILFGLQRMSLFGDLPVTPIRFTSGLSLISIGMWGFVLRLIPEFRRFCICILDTAIDWDSLLAFQWVSEDVLEIEYEEETGIKTFTTRIPLHDRLKVEDLLKKKLLEKVSEGD